MCTYTPTITTPHVSLPPSHAMAVCSGLTHAEADRATTTIIQPLVAVANRPTLRLVGGLLLR